MTHRWLWSVVVAVGGLVSPGSFMAQTDTAPTFEVATVKPSGDSSGSRFGFQGSHFVTQNLPLRELIQRAYNLSSDRQLVGVPKWAESARFDIDAKEDDATMVKVGAMSKEKQIATTLAMLQGLLAERFKLHVHPERRELSVFELRVAKNGLKLKESPAEVGWRGVHIKGNGSMEGQQATTEMMVHMFAGLPEFEGKPLEDKTGLTGKYDFTLNWAAQGDTEAAGPSLFTGLAEQLGLKVDVVKAPVDVVVVDSVGRPSKN